VFVAELQVDELQELAERCLSVGDVQSAAIFAVAPGSTMLELEAVAGLDGPALEGLKTAVRNPEHPVARALTDDGPTFDVLPMNPGGPKLRSHLPLVGSDGDAVGVLAVSHDAPLDAAERSELIQLAARAASAMRH
jgi:hypothetical protein